MRAAHRSVTIPRMTATDRLARAAAARTRTGRCQHDDGCDRDAMLGSMLCAGHVIADTPDAAEQRREQIRSVS